MFSVSGILLYLNMFFVVRIYFSVFIGLTVLLKMGGFSFLNRFLMFLSIFGAGNGAGVVCMCWMSCCDWVFINAVSRFITAFRLFSLVVDLFVFVI